MKNETDKYLHQATTERAKLAKLERQVEAQKAKVEEAEKQLLKALSAAHSNRPESVATTE